VSVAEQIKPFLDPKSVALIGISRRTGTESLNVLEGMLEQGYKGKIYPVNPNASEIVGVKAYPTVADIPDGVDLAVVLTPREVVPDVVRDCANKGIRSVVVVGQGFADGVDGDGQRLQDEIVSITQGSGVRVVGPNTIGTANAFRDFSLSFLKLVDMEKIPVGLISQSGIFFGRINELNMIGKGIDLGNCCDVDHSDCLEYFEDDPDTKVIALHIEGIRDGKRFLEVAGRVSQKKPIVVLKTGRSQQASRAAQSHTGSIIGRDEVWDAAFRQCGLIRVDNVDEMSDLLKVFCYVPTMAGRGIGVLTFTGGLGIVAIDSCEAYGLEVVELASETRQRIIDVAPPWLGVGNPLDLWPAVMTGSRRYGDSLKDGLHMFMEDPGIHAAILILASWMERTTPSLTDVLLEVAHSFPQKPMVLCPYEGWLHDVRRKELEETLRKTGKVLVLPTGDRAIKALSRVAKYSEYRRSLAD